MRLCSTAPTRVCNYKNEKYDWEAVQTSDNLGKVTSSPGGSPPPDPEDDPRAPHFEQWPAQRSFSEVLKDKTSDTIGVGPEQLVFMHGSSFSLILIKSACYVFGMPDVIVVWT